MDRQETGTDAAELVSLAQAADLAGLDSSTLRRRIQAGRLRHVRVGRSYATTLRWIAESEEPGQMGRPPKRLPEHLRPAPGRPKPPQPARGPKSYTA